VLTQDQPTELVLSHEAVVRIGRRLVGQFGAREQLEDELLIVRDNAVMVIADKLGITFEAARQTYAALQRAVAADLKR
jgi:hypothetical protein